MQPGRTVTSADSRNLPAVAGAMLALAVVMTHPLAFHLASALPNDLGDPLFNTFILGWDADRISHLCRGLWNAPFFYPTRDALALSDHLLGIAAFTAPVQWITGNAVLAYNLAFIGSYVLAGVGMYLLVLSLWGRRDAAWIGALAFAFAPHRVMHVSHLQMLMSGWMPISLYGLHRYFATGSRGALALFGVTFALQALSSGYLMYLLALTVLVVVLVEVGRWARNRRRMRDTAPRSLARLGVELGVTAIVLVLVLAPTAAAYLRVRQATGLRRTLGEMSLFSATVADYWRIPERLWLWAGRLGTGLPERMVFPGIVVAALAAVALAVPFTSSRSGERRGGGRAWAVWLYMSILALAVWLSLGPALAGPYGSLVHLVPGFDGLRVPARFVVVVALALAVLAGAGSAWLASRLGPRARVMLVVILGAAIVAEGYGGAMALAGFDVGQPDRRALNSWLASAPDGAVLELPISGPTLAPFTLGYQFNTLVHHHPIVNGYSGIGYGLQDFLGGPGAPLNDPVEVAPVLRGLRSLGVRYVVLHRRAFENRPALGSPSALPTTTAIDAETDQLVARVQLGDTWAWRLADVPPPPDADPGLLVRIPSDQLVANASAMDDRVPYALDGDVDTRWFSGAPQAGREWFRVVLPRDAEIGRLVIRTGRSGLGDRPRNLVLEAEAVDGTRRVLFDGSIVPQMIESIARQGSTAPVAIDLAPNKTRTLWLRQTGRAGRWHWAIHELEIWERRR